MSMATWGQRSVIGSSGRVILGAFEGFRDGRLYRITHISAIVPPVNARAEVSHLGKIHTEGVHVQPVQEARKALAEPRQALVHQLQLHEVGLQVRHGVAELRERHLEVVQRRRFAAVRPLGAPRAVAEGTARAGPQGCRGPRARRFGARSAEGWGGGGCHCGCGVDVLLIGG
jgi:hypothetical protein